jgi:hypothetical protein
MKWRLRFSKLVQLSIDGPYVNWCAFNKLQAKLQEGTGKSLSDKGSCDLHTVHIAFRAAVTDTGWGITPKLSAMYTLLRCTFQKGKKMYLQEGKIMKV